MQIIEGQLRFGIHAGQQNTDLPSHLALWRKAEDLGLDWASAFDHFLPIFSDPEGRASTGRPCSPRWPRTRRGSGAG